MGDEREPQAGRGWRRSTGRGRGARRVRRQRKTPPQPLHLGHVHRQNHARRFERATGAEVRVSYYATNDELFAKLREGNQATT
jgi:hypothetical protein